MVVLRSTKNRIKINLRAQDKQLRIIDKQRFSTFCFDNLNITKPRNVKHKPLNLKKESFNKDSVRRYCQDKMSINKWILNQAKQNDACLVLDGDLARTSKILIKKDIEYIDIPNYSTAYYSLQKLSNKFKQIIPHHQSLHDFVKGTSKEYNLVYMDTCGFFETSSNEDLKNTIKLFFEKKLLKPNGIFGVTVSSRTSGSQNAWGKCENWIIEQSNLQLVWSKNYGQFRTMFFQ